MRISEIATRAGVTAKAVRYYESLGLITPARLGNGYRDYTPHEVRLVCEIREHAFYPVFPPNRHAQQVLAWLRWRRYHA